MSAANDNLPPPQSSGRMAPVIGFVSGQGRVTITDPSWRPTPAPDLAALFPNDPREA